MKILFCSISLLLLLVAATYFASMAAMICRASRAELLDQSGMDVRTRPYIRRCWAWCGVATFFYVASRFWS